MFFIYKKPTIYFQERTFLLGRKNILITEVSQLANMLLISNKISINKNKQIYFFYFSLFFSIDIFHFPTAVGTVGLFIACESWANYRGKLRQISVSGKGASQEIGSLETGCTNSTWRESRLILPSGLLRGAPYLRSPLIGQPILASWQRIWWWRPVKSCTSIRW